MKFPYYHFRDKTNPDETIAKPMIEIRLSHGFLSRFADFSLLEDILPTKRSKQVT